MNKKYKVRVPSNDIDVYDVLVAFGVTCPARQHAIKKLLRAGQRGQKSVRDDLREAQASIIRALEISSGPLPLVPETYPVPSSDDLSGILHGGEDGRQASDLIPKRNND